MRHRLPLRVFLQVGPTLDCQFAGTVRRATAGSRVWPALIFAGLYVASASGGECLSPVSDPFVTFWLPSGLYLGVLLCLPRSRWTGIVLAGCVANVLFDRLHGRPWALAAAFAMGNSLEAFVGAWLIRRFIGAASPLHGRREVVIFFAGALGGTLLSAVVGTTALRASGVPSVGWETSWRWWMSDMVGVLLVAPMIVALREGRRFRVRPAFYVEAGVLAVLIVVAYWFALLEATDPSLPRKFLLMPLIVWAGLRLPVRVIAVFSFLLGIAGSWNFLHVNRSVALAAEAVEAGLLWQAFLATSCAVGLVVATVCRQNRRTEAALREESGRLQLALQAGRMGAWDWDLETGRIAWTSQHAALWGMAADAFDGQFSTYVQRILPEDRPAFEAALQRARHEKAAIDSEFRVSWPDGSVHWIQSRGQCVTDATGKVIRLTGVVVDATESKAAAEALRASEAALKRSQRAAQLGHWDWNLVTNQVVLSDELHRIFGVDREGFGGDMERMLRAVAHAEDVETVLTAYRAVVASGEPQAIEFRVVWPNGMVRHVWAQPADLTRDEAQRPVRLTGIVQDITERNHVEQALRHVDVHYRSLFENMLNAVAYCRLIVERGEPTDYLFIDVNTAFVELTGRKDIVGRRVTEAYPEVFEYNPELRKTFGDVVATGVPTRFESHFAPLKIWLLVSAYRIDPGCFVMVLEDITARKKAQQALAESEARYRRLFETETDAILIIERDSGRILDANAAATRLYGYSHAEFLGLTFSGICDESEGSRSPTAAGAAPIAADRHRKKDGTIVVVEMAASYFENAGRHIRVAAIRDITERKRAEAELRKLSRAIEQSPVVVMITDVDGAIDYVNPSFTATTGYTLAEVRGTNPRVLKSGEQRDGFYHDLWSTITAGREWRGEFRNRKKNGELFWEAAIISPICNEYGEITHYLAVKQDITEHKRLEMQLRHMQKMDAVGQLAGGIAHDFNNILAATMLHLNLLQKEAELAPPIRASLKELEHETRRAAALTRQLLLFSRRQIMQVKPVDMNDTVANLIRMLRRLIGENIKLSFPGVDLPLWIEADSGMIEQVILNLCVNARDAMPNGGMLTIDTRLVTIDESGQALHPAARPGRFVRLDVGDTGSGMDEETMKRLFEPFFTTKDIGKGTGLGLATVYGIVRQHHGWITVESAVGRGSTFSVFLPALAEERAPAVVSSETPITGGHELILLVEDDPEMRRMLVLTLQSYGYRVLEASNGRQALQLWREQPQAIDLLFTDIVMPEGTSGLALADQLRRARPTLPVIVSSGYSAELNAKPGVADNTFVYLAKPFRAETLAALVRNCLDRK